MDASFQETYDQLLAKYKDITVLRSASAIVYWDMETKMPAKGLEIRSEQLSLMDLMAHQMTVDPSIEQRLQRIEKDRAFASLSPEQRRNVHLIRKSYDEESKLPDTLVAEMSKQQTLSVGNWKKAKAAKDFALFKPYLERTIELKKQAAEIWMKVKGTKTPYDALLDMYEPGMPADRISEVFAGMREGLIRIMRRAESASDRPDPSILSKEVPVEAQRKFSGLVMDFLGYTNEGPEAWGRLDETEHPFSNGYYDDERITTHYYVDNFKSSLFSVMHETGHALYEHDLPRQWMYQPIGAAASYGIHESQSRYVENMIGRSPEFVGYLLPKLRKFAGKALAGVAAKDMYRAVNAVEPSKIRIEADEVTYGLHIIIRFELERDIFADRLKVEELPQAWNEKYDQYLGVEIQNDSEGVMQDTHWAGGSYGYFPSYALGNIYGGMFLKKMGRDVPEWRAAVRKGDFGPVKNWLAENVHSKGNLYDPADLVKVVTGEELTIGPFISYLDEKVASVYGR
jgi:carboxypeptidase Taq